MESSERPDCLRLRSWTVDVFIGVYEHEETSSQPLTLDVALYGNFSEAARSDDLEKTLDYADFKKRVEASFYGRHWNLLETFAEDLCRLCLVEPLVVAVELQVEKPRAIAPALVSYKIFRKK